MKIAFGTSRVAIVGHRLTFKLPNPQRWRLFLYGLLANMQETTFAKTGWPELCPVFFSLPGGFLVVMPTCRIHGEKLSEEDYLAFTQKEDYAVPAENKADTFGYYQDRMVAVDYGS